MSAETVKSTPGSATTRDEQPMLTPAQQLSIARQQVIGWFQTILLVIVVVQSIFAGFLRALPPDLRASLGFLHRIEWGVYLGIILVMAQVGVSWGTRTVLTNRLRLLACRFGKLHLETGLTARRLQIAYLLLAFAMIVALLWVRANGFIVQPTR